MLTHCCWEWNQQEPRGGGEWDAGKQWKVNQPPPLFPSGPAGFVLEQNELLTAAFWLYFSSVSTSKGKEHCAERSPSTGSLFTLSLLFLVPLFLTSLYFSITLTLLNNQINQHKFIWSLWQFKPVFSITDLIVLQFTITVYETHCIKP